MAQMNELAVVVGQAAAAMKRAYWAVEKAEQRVAQANAALAHAVESRDQLVAVYDQALIDLKNAAKNP